MTETTLFMSNKSQSVRIPADARFPPNVKKVNVRVSGKERIVSPVGATWDSFFDAPEKADPDFKRAESSPSSREDF